MKQSNLKLAKHEGTDLSRGNIAICEVIKHEIMENLNLDLFISKTPFSLSGATKQAGSAVTHKCSECKKKSLVLFSALSTLLPLRYVKYKECCREFTQLLLFAFICNHVKSALRRTSQLSLLMMLQLVWTLFSNPVPWEAVDLLGSAGLFTHGLCAELAGLRYKERLANLTVHETQKPPWSTGLPQG